MDATPPHRTIGMTSLTLDGDYSGPIVLGIQEVVRKHGARLILFQGKPDEVLTSTALVDGWIAVMFAAGLDRLMSAGALCVSIAAVAPAGAVPAVLSDNVGGVAAAIAHLVAHGHRRIGFVGHRNSEDINQRFEGYRATLAKHGLALAPELVFEAPNDEIAGGSVAGRLLIEAGMPCSAVFVATDENAIGLLEELQRHGYRVPEDLALISFDNIDQSQHTSPPLTTISQRPDMLGRTAAQLLLQQLEGQPAPAVTYVSTALVLRRSCGCQGLIQPSILVEVPDSAATRTWKEALAEELVRLAFYPAAPPAGMAIGEIWPGVTALIEQLEAVATGQTPAARFDLATIWEQALRLTLDLDVLQTILKRLRRRATSQFALTPESPAWEAVEDYLLQAHVELMRVRLSGAMSQIDFLRDYVVINYAVSMRLLGGGLGDATSLSWLQQQSSIDWGCLGLWDDLDGESPATITVAGCYHREQDLSWLVGQRCPAAEFPPQELIQRSEGGPNHVVVVLPIRRHGGPLDSSAILHYHHSRVKRGVIVLYAPLDNQLSSNKLVMWSMFLSVALERENLLASLARAKEAAEDANRLKTAFLANMSHELRTPLGAILNFTQFLGDPDISDVPLSAQQRTFQQRVLSNGEHLLGLINDMLDLAKIEAGRMEIHPQALELSPLLHGVMSTAIGLTADKGLTLSLELPAELPPVWADKTRIRQVLLNLISNAAKFTRQGGITLRATVRADAPHAGLEHAPGPRRWVLVAVQDTGIGIPQEQQHLVFEEFRQVEHELAHEQIGTGLGMPISRKFVELHGGQLWLESAPGVGTTVFFTLPVI